MFVLLYVLVIYKGRNATLVDQCIKLSRRPVRGQVDRIYHDKLSCHILLSVGDKNSPPTHQIHRQKLKYFYH